MFNKLKEKAAKPLTYGWLYKCYIGELIAVGVVYGGMWLYGAYLERKANASETAEDITADYNKFDEED